MRPYLASPIGFKLENGVGTITLNRPEARNSISEGMFASLLVILTECRGNKSLQVLVIEAEGPVFCAGGDVQFFQQLLAVSPRERKQMLTRYIGLAHHVILALAEIPCLVIAAVRGAAAGYGMSLACAADILLAEQGSRFVPAYAALGTTPDGGLTYRLPTLIGEKRALEVLSTNRPLRAEEALAWGLVNRVADVGNLDQTVADVVEKLSAGSLSAQLRMKALLAQRRLAELATQLDEELQSFILCSDSSDFIEGVQAFLEKREPRFGQG